MTNPAFLLKVSDGASPPRFVTVAGLRATTMSVRAESVSVTGTGVFTGSAAEARVKSTALAGAPDDYQLHFESGETVIGRFLISRLDYAGDFNGERTYTLHLESVGSVVTS